ncbi:NADH dehydrogenase [ubiquinone] 1 alpha subcomplex assembly factor 2 isoform X2 [Brienomyrus brachyistius]|uniref:NADH dehydrogenase [ubiquinone] 1 alpha subcomplex assembly factor 2 isoform X2 n=1 Tax=Brienomyrus brachyistius TaxID=42636 RepID=UPI0020B36F20|nr:NADH dehydrogenase [ubiquinone] 1 alpha subcomplex assembly factor 2 isoform X2 [Brienomyrus brachyistius]
MKMSARKPHPYCIFYWRTVRARRMMEPSKLVESEYTEGSIPSEWDAWIRGRRKDPPTIEELERNQLYREQIKQKAREVEERDSTLQAQEYAEGLVARSTQTLIEGHASAKHFRQTKPSEDPISTGSTFEPGSWAPNKRATSKK